MLSCFSRVRLFVTPWTIAHQAPLSMEFPRQEYRSGLPFPFPGIFLTLVLKLCLLHSPANVGDLGLISGLGRSLEEEMATHSSILDWEIPWTEEPGGLQSLGLPRVGHD